jgi:hypothetical protein
MDQRLKLQILVVAAQADGAMSEAELDIIADFARKCALDETEIRRLLTTPPNSEAVAALEAAEAQEIFNDLVELSLVDGVVRVAESNFLKDFGKKLGLSPAAVNGMINEARGGAAYRTEEDRRAEARKVYSTRSEDRGGVRGASEYPTQNGAMPESMDFERESSPEARAAALFRAKFPIVPAVLTAKIGKYVLATLLLIVGMGAVFSLRFAVALLVWIMLLLIFACCLVALCLGIFQWRYCQKHGELTYKPRKLTIALKRYHPARIVRRDREPGRFFSEQFKGVMAIVFMAVFIAALGFCTISSVIAGLGQ